MKYLTIIILFCDKDYQYIPSLLSRIDKKVICSFEVLLVDNRENYKDIKIPEIENFKRFHNIKVLSKGYNLCQLAAKKYALQFARGNYIWLVDGDDEIEDTVTSYLLNSIDTDICVFNYIHNYSPTEDKLVYQEVSRKYQLLDDPEKFQSNNYVRRVYPTCWNKWFKKDLLDGIFKDVQDDVKVSCNEDVYIFYAALNRSKSIYEVPLYLYTNYPNRGISANNKINNIESFKTIFQGYEQSYKLLKKEFPVNNQLFNFEEKKESDLSYFIKRVSVSEKNLWEEETNILLEYFDKSELLYSITDIIKNKRYDSLGNLQELYTFISNI